MKLAKSLDTYATKAAKQNVAKGKIKSIDFDRCSVVPYGSLGAIKGAYIVGDPNTLSVGQEVEIVFASNNRTLVMANAERGDNTYALENHAERHASTGLDPITPDMIGAAPKGHSHDVSDVENLPNEYLAKSVYDEDDDGIVDNAYTLQGILPGTYPDQIPINNGHLMDTLNADLLDGFDTAQSGMPNTVAVRNPDGSLSSSRFLSDVTSPYAPLTVASSVKVTNLNADQVDGYDASAFALAANGVTNGNNHDHNGGDGAQINHVNLSNKGTNTHAQIDTHIAAANHFVPLVNPAYSATFLFGQTHSSTAKTLIDTSATWGLPAGIKGIVCSVAVMDSASLSNVCWLILSSNNNAGSGIAFRAGDGWANGKILQAGSSVIPCNANGDLYYQIQASGTNTFTCWVSIWGYWLPG